MVEDLEKPAPQIDTWSAPFWEACRQSKLIAQRCRESGEIWLPPAPISPVTRTAQWDWVELSGRGTVWSFVVMHQCYFRSFAEEIPYSIVQVALEEGPHLLANLIGIEASRIDVGLRVRAVFEPRANGFTIPQFEPMD